MPPKIVLAINAGSSSVKTSVYSTDNQQSDPVKLAELQVSGLTAPPAKLTYQRGHDLVHKDAESSQHVSSAYEAFNLILQTLVEDSGFSQVSSMSDVSIAVHRVVHGGDYDDSQIITNDTLHHIEALSDLAPLHNGVALEIASWCMKHLPKATNLACFDSQFHASIPEHVHTYPIDKDIAKKNKLRKYGFHGISYAFITKAAAAHLGKKPQDVNLIALHLGSGASACAIKQGRSLDTSMGLTPVSGLPGATRSGSVDPSLIFHYDGKRSSSSMHVAKAEEILNKEAGWKALTGTTDFGVIASSDEPTHKLAFDILVDRVSAYIGSYYVALSGQVDALVFAGGIGEKSAKLRAAVVARTECLGFSVDESKNESKLEGVVEDISSDSPRDSHKVLVLHTDEQLEMARQACVKDELWK